jgi:hypothetical protein
MIPKQLFAQVQHLFSTIANFEKEKLREFVSHFSDFIYLNKMKSLRVSCHIFL